MKKLFTLLAVLLVTVTIAACQEKQPAEDSAMRPAEQQMEQMEQPVPPAEPAPGDTDATEMPTSPDTAP